MEDHGRREYETKEACNERICFTSHCFTSALNASTSTRAAWAANTLFDGTEESSFVIPSVWRGKRGEKRVVFREEGRLCLFMHLYLPLHPEVSGEASAQLV